MQNPGITLRLKHLRPKEPKFSDFQVMLQKTSGLSGFLEKAEGLLLSGLGSGLLLSLHHLTFWGEGGPQAESPDF